MKTILTAVVAMLALAGVATAETKTLNVNGIETEVKLSASGGFYNLVDPDALNSAEPGLEARRSLAVAQAIQSLNR